MERKKERKKERRKKEWKEREREREIMEKRETSLANGNIIELCTRGV